MRLDETSVSEVAMVKLRRLKKQPALCRACDPGGPRHFPTQPSSAFISPPPLLRSYVDKATKPIADLAPGI